MYPDVSPMGYSTRKIQLTRNARQELELTLKSIRLFDLYQMVPLFADWVTVDADVRQLSGEITCEVFQQTKDRWPLVGVIEATQLPRLYGHDRFSSMVSQ